MDFDSIASAIWNQIVTVWNAPVPFIAAVLIVAYVIWRVVQWQFGVRLANLTSQLDLYRESNAISSARSLDAEPAARPPTASRLPPPEPASVATEDAGEREFIVQGVTLRMLKEIMHRGTTLQGQRAAEPYIGKWMRIRGKVLNIIGSPSGRFLVSLLEEESERASMPHINLFFASDEGLDDLAAGDTVEAIGKLEEVDPISIMFTDCELVN